MENNAKDFICFTEIAPKPVFQKKTYLFFKISENILKRPEKPLYEAQTSSSPSLRLIFKTLKNSKIKKLESKRHFVEQTQNDKRIDRQIRSTRRQSSKRRKRSDTHFADTSGFHPFLQSSQTIEFYSTFNFSDPMDGSMDRNGGSNSDHDQTPSSPVTEMSDLELKRLGFPVPATTTESVYSILHGFSGSGSGAVIDSPYIKITSRKY